MDVGRASQPTQTPPPPPRIFLEVDPTHPALLRDWLQRRSDYDAGSENICGNDHGLGPRVTWVSSVKDHYGLERFCLLSA